MNSLKKVLVYSFDSESGRNGFTLVELMITVAILSVLAAVAIPLYANYINRAKQADAIIGLKAAQMAQEQFFSENGEYSSTIELLPGFDDGTIDDDYVKGEYALSADTTSDGFEIEAIWDDSDIGIDDRWTINETNIDPVCDTSKDGIKGYSIFSWLFG